MIKTYKTYKRWRRMPASRARSGFAETLNNVAYGGEWIVIQKHEKDLAGIVPYRELRVLMDQAEHEREDLATGQIGEAALARLMGWHASDVRKACARVKLRRLSALFLRAWDLALSLREARSWFQRAIRALGNRTPKELILRGDLEAVAGVLSEIESGPAL